ncbi:hypothetical protein CLOSTMETH_00604 [[Clostridium] methylpentosum DSM 5476]|uniref:Uncharacterized protein n=1 Tax=[Clostridium] methylpentosum DSM 5476 TaxID=537013 RepID=C0E9V3_9FIRM|nr:hypothetical protein CLOSTMETH_00604 [[Clostridium] methylpentosum DSM 5476]
MKQIKEVLPHGERRFSALSFFDQRSQSSAEIATLREDALSNWLLCEKKTALCIGLSAILLFDPDQVVCIQFHFEKTQFRVAGGACSGV